MVGTYTSISDVEAELGGVAINGTTTPNNIAVDGWIQDAEDEVELLSGQVYATTAVSSTVWEYHSYDGTGVIKLNNFPVQSVELIQYEENGAGNTSESWVTLVGPGIVSSTNFHLYGDIGALKLHPNTTSNSPLVGDRNIRVAYTYGQTSVPRTVKQLVTKMVAKRYIDSFANKSGTSEGGAISVGAISISDPTNYVTGRLSQIEQDIRRLQERVVGTLRTVQYDHTLYG